MTVILKDHAYDLKQFTISKDRKGTTLIAEAAELGFNAGGDFRRIYDDACDVGIAIRNPRTSQTVRFHEIECDVREGDVCGWWFAPIVEDCRKFPGLANMRVLIIND